MRRSINPPVFEFPTCERPHQQKLVFFISYYRDDHIKEEQVGEACSKFKGEMKCMHRVLVGKHEGKRPRGGLSRRWEDIEMDLERKKERMNECMNEWNRIEVRGEVLWTGQWTFRFYKMWGISSLTEGLLASQEGFRSVEIFIWCLLDRASLW